jgi:hypothetical protein
MKEEAPLDQFTIANFHGLYFNFRILRQKCKYDSEFLALVNEIKTTAKDSLGLLILLPVGALRISLITILIVTMRL